MPDELEEFYQRVREDLQGFAKLLKEQSERLSRLEESHRIAKDKATIWLNNLQDEQDRQKKELSELKEDIMNRTHVDNTLILMARIQENREVLTRLEEMIKLTKESPILMNLSTIESDIADLKNNQEQGEGDIINLKESMSELKLLQTDANPNQNFAAIHILKNSITKIGLKIDKRFDELESVLRDLCEISNLIIEYSHNKGISRKGYGVLKRKILPLFKLLSRLASKKSVCSHGKGEFCEVCVTNHGNKAEVDEEPTVEPNDPTSIITDLTEAQGSETEPTRQPSIIRLGDHKKSLVCLECTQIYPDSLVIECPHCGSSKARVYKPNAAEPSDEEYWLKVWNLGYEEGVKFLKEHYVPKDRHQEILKIKREVILNSIEIKSNEGTLDCCDCPSYKCCQTDKSLKNYVPISEDEDLSMNARFIELVNLYCHRTNQTLVDIDSYVPKAELPPKCPECQSVFRPDINDVLFDCPTCNSEISALESMNYLAIHMEKTLKAEMAQRLWRIYDSKDFNEITMKLRKYIEDELSQSQRDEGREEKEK